MSLTLNNISLGGFTNADEYYTINDLTWSLQYSVCGIAAAQAGICTSLYTGDAVDANNSLLGGPGKALGVAPSQDFNAIDVPGLTSPVLTIAVDSLGSYALADAALPGTADLYTNGDPTSALNPDVLLRQTYVTVRDKDFFVIDSVPVDYSIVTDTQQFKILRFRLTQGGNKLIVSKVQDNEYIDIANFNVNLASTVSDKCKIMVTYASPLVNNDAPAARFDVARFHVQGSTTTPTVATLTEPLNILSLPFENIVSIAVAPSAQQTNPNPIVIGTVDISTLSLTAIAASATYLSLGGELSAFITNNTANKQVLTYDNNATS